MQKQIITAGLVTLAVAALIGCKPITAADALDEQGVSTGAASAMAAEATVIASSMTESQVNSTGGTVANAAQVTSECPSVAVTASNGGVWTAEQLTFPDTNCVFSGARGYASLQVTGVVNVSRNGDDGLSFATDASNQTWNFAGGYSETRNGSRNIQATATSASVANNMTVTFAGASYAGTLINQMTTSFTPASGSKIVAGQWLPSGDFNYTGSVQFTLANGANGTMNITTPVPMAFSTGCKSTDASVFTSGEMDLHFAQDKESSSHAKVVWSNCGAPAVTYVTEPASN